MIPQPVLIAIPEDDSLSGPQRVARQRAYARRALAICAGRCGVDNREWTKDHNNVPQPCAGYYWSIAHKPLWVAAVIADRPVGIDLEHVKPRRADLFDEVGTAEEWSAVGERSWPAFFRLWTAKEAVLKANGVGIAKLSLCRVVESRGEENRVMLDYAGRSWWVEHLAHEDHLAALTTEGGPVNWHIEGGTRQAAPR